MGVTRSLLKLIISSLTILRLLNLDELKTVYVNCRDSSDSAERQSASVFHIKRYLVTSNASIFTFKRIPFPNSNTEARLCAKVATNHYAYIFKVICRSS